MKIVLCVSLAVLAVAGRVNLRALLLGVASLYAAGAGSTVLAAATNVPVAAGPFVVQPPFIAPPLPESVFVSPKNQSEGRDPFFPKSDRPYLQFNPAKPVQVVAVKPQADLALKGISGTPEQPLAIINNATFASGEENDVVTKAGKMRIQCVEIRMDEGVVVVQVGGERRILRLAAMK